MFAQIHSNGPMPTEDRVGGYAIASARLVGRVAAILLLRGDTECEVIPMCRGQAMAIAAWAPLGQGRFKTAEAREAAHTGGRSVQMNEDEVKVSEALKAVAKLMKTMRAFAYILHKSPYVYPIIGQRKA
ncbi:hypothetical protein Asppvi_009422 [Aspergillus pseudoviridinutans]|uniref:NADP-dependent oxidoreductase domain-containing protein n=1 Tax=Aspergillus pseudoviridinutans TaxID=1517512 RepID=A0A9P3BFQ4_9EURO|nr:uncharacterized protein Asppvi_009422 [Aspergillus pseudoviridinutans]GIJ90467.1 hypothetical protein Asppvi_009422 [Aspergillus pseudoviridinutans]